jgi:formylglycine-generating enzyme required for sulfatase activity
MGYIVPADAPNPHNNPEGFKVKAIDMEMMEVYAKRMDSKHALFLFDCCFSGSIFSLSKAAPAIINYKTSKPVRQFITAGGADEEVPDESIFCRQFIVGLQGEADLNKDNYISGSELGEYLQTSVVNYSYDAQHPQYGKIRNPNLDKGDFIFVLEKPGNQPATASPAISIKEETGTGSVKIIAYFDGKLSWEYGFLKEMKANTSIVLDDVQVGKHMFQLLDGGPGKESNAISKQFVVVNKNEMATVYMGEPKSSDTKPLESKAAIPKKQYDNMVFVEGGSFMMGNNNGQADEKPVHKVNLDGFYIDTYETTVADFSRFVDATGYKTEVEQRGFTWLSGTKRKKAKNVSWRCDEKGKERSLKDANRPATFLSKKDAEAYCKWRGGRLPTEAEWEYAACGGQKSKGYQFAGSNNADEVGWYNENSGGTSHPAGQKKPNELGIYDMSGNVWEYCSDYYDENYYSSSPSNNPCSTANKNYDVARGGSWYYVTKFARTTDRSGWKLFGNTNTGVRCVRDE